MYWLTFSIGLKWVCLAIATIMFVVSNSKPFDTTKMTATQVNVTSDVCSLVAKIDYPHMFVYRNMNNKWTNIRKSSERRARDKYNHFQNIKNMKLVPPGIGNNVINKDKFLDGQAIPFFVIKDKSGGENQKYGSTANPWTRNANLWGGGDTTITPQWEEFYVQLERDFAGSSLLEISSTSETGKPQTYNYITDPLYGPVLEMHSVAYERMHTRYGKRHRDNWHNECSKEPDELTGDFFSNGKYGANLGQHATDNMWFTPGQAGKANVTHIDGDDSKKACYKSAYSAKCQCAMNKKMGKAGVLTTLYKTNSDGIIKFGDPTNTNVHSSPFTAGDSSSPYDPSLVSAGAVLLIMYLAADMVMQWMLKHTNVNRDAKVFTAVSALLLLAIWIAVLLKYINIANPKNGAETFMLNAGNDAAGLTMGLSTGAHYQLAGLCIELLAVLCILFDFVYRWRVSDANSYFDKGKTTASGGAGFF